jgi:hypothetical protein
VVDQMLMIISREQPAQYAYRKPLFEKQALDVIVDRRVGERRQLIDQARPERRGRDRRQSDVTKDLQRFGWAIVRRSET